MYAAEFLIARLEEQIKLAPKLEESFEAGGSIAAICERLKEGMSRASGIEILRPVEQGARRYAKHFAAALDKIEPLKALFDRVNELRSGEYADGAQREAAMAQTKDTPAKIVGACKSAIEDLKAALKVIEEGERKDVKDARLVGAGR